MSIYDQLNNQHNKFKDKKDDDIDLPSSFSMKSPLFNGIVYLDFNGLAYLDSDKIIRIKEKNQKKLFSKIKKYGYTS